MATNKPKQTRPPKPAAVSIPADFEETVLRPLVFQTFGRARKTQDSPIVPDVWLAFMRIALAHAQGRDVENEGRVDLLLTPWTGTTPGDLIKRLRDGLPEKPCIKAKIAQCTSRVVLEVDFATLIRYIMPLSVWWQRLNVELRLATSIRAFLPDEESSDDKSIAGVISRAGTKIEFIRYALLVGFAARLIEARTKNDFDQLNASAQLLVNARTTVNLTILEEINRLLARYQAIMGTCEVIKVEDPKGLYLINLNRSVSQALFESRRTVKADAAERVFDLGADGIAFAVVDGGVDARHPAFLNRSESKVKERLATTSSFALEDLVWSSRIKATYDFTKLRDIDLPFSSSDLDWRDIEPKIKVSYDAQYKPPASDHGTHVAGIIGANWPDPPDSRDPLVGMARNITLYDLRVFDENGKGDEFAIISALEFVDWLNRDRNNPVIHGINLSLALVHDVESFACGQTPICDVCNRLVGAGTVVVAASGNSGFETSANRKSMGNGYRMMSITDPGNADLVITVGSTHRRDPHAYGVSFFSARGPTGDGRAKPDILAPGEKITSTIRDGRSQRMDGTSMAAPHVSGAAALLMSRYPELIGRPIRIKEILMNTATDLKREPYFQGAGLLDVLRALQSV